MMNSLTPSILKSNYKPYENLSSFQHNIDNPIFLLSDDDKKELIKYLNGCIITVMYDETTGKTTAGGTWKDLFTIGNKGKLWFGQKNNDNSYSRLLFTKIDNENINKYTNEKKPCNGGEKLYSELDTLCDAQKKQIQYEINEKELLKKINGLSSVQRMKKIFDKMNNKNKNETGQYKNNKNRLFKYKLFNNKYNLENFINVLSRNNSNESIKLTGKIKEILSKYYATNKDSKKYKNIMNSIINNITSVNSSYKKITSLNNINKLNVNEKNKLTYQYKNVITEYKDNINILLNGFFDKLFNTKNKQYNNFIDNISGLLKIKYFYTEISKILNIEKTTKYYIMKNYSNDNKQKLLNLKDNLEVFKSKYFNINSHYNDLIKRIKIYKGKNPTIIDLKKIIFTIQYNYLNIVNIISKIINSKNNKFITNKSLNNKINSINKKIKILNAGLTENMGIIERAGLIQGNTNYKSELMIIKNIKQKEINVDKIYDEILRTEQLLQDVEIDKAAAKKAASEAARNPSKSAEASKAEKNAKIIQGKVNSIKSSLKSLRKEHKKSLNELTQLINKNKKYGDVKVEKMLSSSKTLDLILEGIYGRVNGARDKVLKKAEERQKKAENALMNVKNKVTSYRESIKIAEKASNNAERARKNNPNNQNLQMKAKQAKNTLDKSVSNFKTVITLIKPRQNELNLAKENINRIKKEINNTKIDYNNISSIRQMIDEKGISENNFKEYIDNLINIFNDLNEKMKKSNNERIESGKKMNSAKQIYNNVYSKTNATTNAKSEAKQSLNSAKELYKTKENEFNRYNLQLKLIKDKLKFAKDIYKELYGELYGESINENEGIEEIITENEEF